MTAPVAYDAATLLALAKELDEECAYRVTQSNGRVGFVVQRLMSLAKSYRKRAAGAKESA